jgi:hypothetical protein
VADPETGRLLVQQQAPLAAVPPHGSYVLGIAFGNRAGDCYLSHGLHPFATTVTVHGLRLWSAPGRLSVDRSEPTDATGLVEVAGGLVLGGRLEQAAATYERALAVDPGNVAALCGLALTEDRRGRTAAGGAPLARAMRLAPYPTAVWLEDLGRVAPAGERARIGRVLRAALGALGQGADGDTLLARALGHSLLGDLDVAYGLVGRVATAGRDDTAVRYLRRRNHWGPVEQINDDWRWLESRKTVLPGTEPPVVCWAPPPGAAAAATRVALARAWQEFSAAGGMERAMRCWVAACRQLTEAPDDVDALAVRGQVGIALRRHGITERDWKARARLRADDPAAALAVAQLYALRQARGETLAWLEAAVQRGLRWNDVDDAVREQLAFLAGEARYAAALAAAGGG